MSDGKQEIIDTVVETLSKYTGINFERVNDYVLKIYSGEHDGFDIMLYTDQHENTLYLGAFHWHYNNTEGEVNEMLSQLALALSGMSRIKEFSKNGKVYKSIIQVRDGEGDWHDDGVMGVISFNFWSKTEIRYKQNHLIPEKDIN